jgi:tRNA threonylcarbamoyladenosine biosynthesis protein TsaB
MLLLAGENAMLLALDTSTHLAGLALCENGELRAEYTWDVGANHSVELLRRVEGLLQERGLSMTQISAVAAAIGPGSFTGVRVAVTVAKTLAFSLKAPLVGISTLDVIAYNHAAAAFPVCALMEAGRGEFYAAFYRQGYFEDAARAGNAFADAAGVGSWLARSSSGNESRFQGGLYWQRQGEYRVLTVEELSREIQEPTLLCGELRPDSRRNIAAVLGSFGLFTRSLSSIRHASLLAELALQRLERDDIDDPLTLEPLYLRRPAITVSTKQRPQLLGPSASSGMSPQEPSDDSEQRGVSGSLEHQRSDNQGAGLSSGLRWAAPRTVSGELFLRQGHGKHGASQAGWLV